MRRAAVAGIVIAAAYWPLCVVGAEQGDTQAPPTREAKARPALKSEGPAPKIKVAPAPAGNNEPTPTLRAAYRALQLRDYETAARLYEDVARAEPRNIDALLGLAAVTAQRGELGEARRLYLEVLRLEPKNAAAQGALLALFGSADYGAAELKLKELIARDPSAFLFQALGTLYAEQALWPQAQQAYFQAYHLDPANADQVFNLAVSLEHVGQRRLAATYYRRAVELARSMRAPAFDVARAEERAAQITAAEGY